MPSGERGGCGPPGAKAPETFVLTSCPWASAGFTTRPVPFFTRLTLVGFRQSGGLFPLTNSGWTAAIPFPSTPFRAILHRHASEPDWHAAWRTMTEHRIAARIPKAGVGAAALTERGAQGGGRLSSTGSPAPPFPSAFRPERATTD